MKRELGAKKDKASALLTEDRSEGKLSDELKITDLLERALFLVRSTALSYLWIYYIATIPFMCLLINFFYYTGNNLLLPADISRFAIMLSVLFWLKEIGQTIYCKQLLSNLMNEKACVSKKFLFDISIKAIFLSSVVLIISPFFLVTIIFMGYLIMFSQYLLMFSTEPNTGILETIKMAYTFSTQESLYHHYFLFILLLLYLIITINIYFLAYLAPIILSILFNVQIIFNPFNKVTFLVILCASYLVFDPILKSCFVNMFFILKTQGNGEDIIVECKKLAKARGIILTIICLILSCLLAFPAKSSAKAPGNEDQKRALNGVIKKMAINPNNIDYTWLKGLIDSNSIDERDIKDAQTRIEYIKLHKSEDIPINTDEIESFRNTINAISDDGSYGWRHAGKGITILKKRNFITQMIYDLFSTLADWLTPVTNVIRKLYKRIAEFVKKILQDREKAGQKVSDFSFFSEPQTVILLVIILFLLIVIFIFRLYNKDNAVIKRGEKRAVPDLSKEDVDATDLKDREWLQLHSGYLSKGELNLALRSSFLALLSSFHEKHYISFTLYKTNYNYLYEVKNNSRNDTEIINRFKACIDTFERIWYGRYPINMQVLERFEENRQLIMEHI